jgi:hypothetical protein
MAKFSYLTCLKLLLNTWLFLYYLRRPVTCFTYTLLKETCINFNNEQVVAVNLCVMA